MFLPVEEHAKHPHSPHLFVAPKTGTMFDPDSFRHTHEKILKAIGAEHIRFPDLSAFGSRFGSSEKRQNTASLFEDINRKSS